MSRTLAVAALSALLLVLPFEPRRPTLPVAGLELTLLEAVAAAAVAVLLYANRYRLAALVRRPPLPLVFLGSYVAAQFLSAAVAPMNRALAVKFAVRMAAAAVFALAVAATPRDVLRRGLPALTVSCAVVAVLAILEGAGVTALDPFLDRFRAGPFLIGTSRRASAGSESPNLAAAMLLYGLVPAIGAATLRPRPARIVAPLAALFSLGVLFTYSRGGLAALAAAFATLGLALALRGGRAARAAAVSMATLLLAGAGFALTGRSPRLPYPGRGVPPHAVRYAPGEPFLSLGPGEARAVPLTLTNTGRRAWETAVLGCTWQRADAELATDWAATARCPIAPVPPAAPGESVRVAAEILAPAREGRYLLVWDLVADGWIMSSAGVAPAAVPTIVSRDPATARPFSYALPAGAWQRGRAALWRAALAMWRDHPLTGVGPDNFRWAHAAYTGRPRAGRHETLVAANNMFLEAAATTGTLGLIALVGTFIATARASVRDLERSAAGSVQAVFPAVLLALTAGIAVHGAVDSFLGFTGHYLFLGFLVGAASSTDAADAGLASGEAPPQSHRPTRCRDPQGARGSRPTPSPEPTRSAWAPSAHASTNHPST